MSLLNLALAYAWHRRGVSALLATSLAIASALILLVLEVQSAVARGFGAGAQGYELVIGPPGGEVALVLAALFHAEEPRGNLPFTDMARIEALPGVRAVYPFCLGDTFRGARIVGTTRAFLDQANPEDKPLLPLESGRLFDADFEIVAGAEAARRLGLELGTKVISTHSRASESATRGEAGGAIEHALSPYTVVGILAASGTPRDRVLFTTMGSYWKIHGQAEASAAAESKAPADRDPGFGAPAPEVSLLLVNAAPTATFQVQAAARRLGLLAVRPAAVLAGLFDQVLAPLERTLLLYGFAVALVAATAIGSTLYLATLVRRRDLAILRALGATPREVVTVVALEAFVLLVVGCGLGVLLSQVASFALRPGLETRLGIQLAVFTFTPAEVYALAGVFALGMAATITPAVAAYRGDVADALRRM